MPELNWLAVIVAAVVVFVVSTVYYILFTSRMQQLSPAYADAGGTPEPWKVSVELLRSLVVGTVALLGIVAIGDALLLALALWVAFPVVLLVGSVIWEKVPPALAAIHSGDWLLKLLIIAVIVTIWT